jgi:hypothetical protein
MLSLFFWFSALVGDNIVWGTSEDKAPADPDQSTAAILERQ